MMLTSSKAIKLGQHARRALAIATPPGPDANRPLGDPHYFTAAPQPDTNNGFFTATPLPCKPTGLQATKNWDTAFFSGRGTSGQRQDNNAGSKQHSFHYGRVTASQVAGSSAGDCTASSKLDDEDDARFQSTRLTRRASTSSDRLLARQPIEPPLQRPLLKDRLRTPSSLSRAPTLLTESRPTVHQEMATSGARYMSVDATSERSASTPPPLPSSESSNPPSGRTAISTDLPPANPGRRRANSEPPVSMLFDSAKLAKSGEESRYVQSIRLAESHTKLEAAIRHYRNQGVLSVSGHNTAIAACLNSRIHMPERRRFTLVTELYDEMLSKDLAPNVETISLVIRAHARWATENRLHQEELKDKIAHDQRELEQALEEEVAPLTAQIARHKELLGRLQTQRPLDVALQLYDSLGANRFRISDATIKVLLPATVLEKKHAAGTKIVGCVRDARVTYSIVVQFNDTQRSRPANAALLKGYTAIMQLQQPSDLSTAEAIFSAYKELKEEGAFQSHFQGEDAEATVVARDASAGAITATPEAERAIWTKMLTLYLDSGKAAEAVQLLETMLSANEVFLQPVQFSELLNYFVKTDDFDALFAWTDRILASADELVPRLYQQRISFSFFEQPLESLASRPEHFDVYLKLAKRIAPSLLLEGPELFCALPRQMAAVERATPVNLNAIEATAEFAVECLDILSSKPAQQGMTRPGRLLDVARCTKRLGVSLIRQDRLDKAVELIHAAPVGCKMLGDGLFAIAHKALGAAVSQNAGFKTYLRLVLPLFIPKNSKPIDNNFFAAILTAYRQQDLSKLKDSDEQERAALWMLAGHAQKGEQSLLEVLTSFKEHDLAPRHFLRTNFPPMALLATSKAIMGETDSFAVFNDVFSDILLPRQVKLLFTSAGGRLEPDAHTLPRNTNSATSLTESDVDTTANSATSTPAESDLHSPLLTSVEGESSSGLEAPASPITPPPYLEPVAPAPVKKFRFSSQDAHLFRDPGHTVAVWTTSHLLGRAATLLNPRETTTMAHPAVIAAMLPRLARHEPFKMSNLELIYHRGYEGVGLLADNPAKQIEAWQNLENGMLMAMAIRGAMDRVSVHRERLIQAGYAPSADSYATMILFAKDTTDDATVAIELFEESRKLGVEPNTYLFNNLLSRLSKARRTKVALECFQQMKALDLRPTAITYGSLINACCKIGDSHTAKQLFDEMEALPDFVPRVPPYNTMMQYFTQTQPDRDEALHYFKRMLDAEVRPTEFTYKLLMDCYGAIQPVDTASLRDVFRRLQTDSNVKVESAHWGALISSYGVQQRNLEEAEKIFSEVPAKSKDATCFEAILNACLYNQAFDKVEAYAGQMKEGNIHSTAYVENTRIKAFGANGQIQKARTVFNQLSDPPVGVAAQGNHPNGRRHTRGITQPPSTGAIYREPSTYEAMIRAEVMHGSFDEAVKVYQQALQRAFPPPVTARMQVILDTAPRAEATQAPVSPPEGQAEAEVKAQ